MTALDTPDSGEATRLLKPRRSAHATIRGYLYQTCLGVLRWLELEPNEILLCEGDEDLDRFLLGGGAVSEQVKAYTGGLSLSDRTVLESLGNFLRSYVALRRRGETRRFVFTTTAYEKKRRIGGLNFDLLEEWQKGTRTLEVLDAVQTLLEPKGDDKYREETTEAITWLDAEPEGWEGFMDAVEWSFDAPDLDAIRTQAKNLLAVRDGTSALPAETFLERLIAHVLRTSSQPKPEDRRLDSKALSDLVETARTDLGTWVKTPAAERLRTVFDELKQVQRLLHDNTRSFPELASPSKLLTAAYEVISFAEAGRREELDFLTAWCGGEDRRSVLLLTGEGGSGKTRLMIEWCRHLRHLGWHAGFFRPDRKAEDLDPLLEGVAPRFIVIDYAETRLPAVEPLLLKMGLQAEGQGPKLRLVLLARRKADWWENLSRIAPQVEDLLLRSPEPRAITPLVPQDTAERERVFRAAADGFSFQLGLKRPKDLTVPDLSRSEFERALYLYMAALAALQGESIETADSLLKQTLIHERQFWYDNASLFGSQRDLMSNAFESVLAAVTLMGGVTSVGTLSLVPRILKDFPLSQDKISMSVALLLLYAGPRGEEELSIIEPLQPDLLGEELVAEALSRDEGLLGRVLDGTKPEEASSTLTVLTRLARRRPEFEKWLGTALHGRLEALAEIALDVAVATGDPLGLKLTEQMESLESIEVINRIQTICDSDSYRWSLPLREVARVATERGLELLRASQADLDEEKQVEYARLASNLGVRLSGLGQREDALNATQEAVEIRRQLAQRRPDAFLPALATSLNNLGNGLSDLGRREDALNATQEAVEIYRQLAQNRPDAFLPDLATSLNNLGNMLSDLGRLEDALNATQEAVEIRRQLAQNRPDAFLPDLAMSLNNLGSALSDLGHREDALNATQEAVEIRRQLAQRRPDAFLPDLAMSLNNLGNALSDLGHREDALNATQEAVEIRRQLAQRRPDAFLPALAMSLNNLGKMLSDLGRQEEAFKAYEEAVRSLAPFFLRLPLAFQTRMTTMVRNYREGAETIARSPDETLLAPIAEAFKSLQPPQ